MINMTVGNASSTVMDKLDSNGISVQRQYMQQQPHVPDDLTDLNDEDVMSLYNAFVEYNNFLRIQLSAADIDVLEKNAQLKVADAKFLIEAPKGETVAKTKARALLDPEWSALNDAVNSAEAYAILLKTIEKNVSESAWVVKAELQRRKGQSFLRPYTP
jgi:hypothetical protein